MRASRRLLGMFVGLFVCCGTLGLSGASAFASSGYVYGLNPPVSFSGGEGGFSDPVGIAVNEVATGHEGDVYVADQGENRVDVFDASGTFLGQFDGSGESSGKAGVVDEKGVKAEAGAFSEPMWIAVDNSRSASDPSKGDVYVVDDGHQAVEKFSAEGEFLASLPAPPALGTSPAGFFGEDLLNGVAVDTSGNVSVLNFLAVDQYNNAAKNTFVTGWETGLFSTHPGFGVDTAGNVYLAGGGAKLLHKYTGSGVSEGSIGGECEEECTTALAIDQSAEQLFVGRVPSETVGSEILVQDLSGNESQSPFAIKQVQSLGGLTIASTTHTLYATDPTAGNVKIFKGIIPASFTPGVISDEQPSSVDVAATVNPNAQETTCNLEYGPDTSYGMSVPCNPANIGSGSNPVAVTATLTGVTPGETYHYRLAATSPQGNSYGDDQTFKITLAPLVDEQAGFASNVTQFSATLNGTIDPYNIPTSYHFIYGTTIAYGSSIPVPDIYTQAGTTSEPVIPQTISGLEPNSTYHFALVASSAGGTITSPDETFTTPGIPLPEALTGAASDASVGAVTLSGAVNPNGWDTSYQFQYGTTAAYGASWPSVPVQAGQFNGAQSITIYLQNLQPTTTYHYRLIATNPAGTVYGTDQTFTTSAYPAAAIAEPPGANNLLSKPITKTTPKALTNAQKLTNALKVCKKESKKKRATCEKQARKKYKQTKKKK